MKFEILIIHLPRAEQRRAHVDRLLASLPHPGRVIEAVDGQELSPDEAGRYGRHLHFPPYPFALTRNEVACFLSHRRAWQAIIDLNLDAALVMEDDALPVEDFSASLDLALAHIEAAGFIRFPFRDGREAGRTIAAQGDTRLIEPARIGLGMVTQLISRESAATLLEKTARFDRPLDTLMQMPWATGVYPLSVVPSAVREISATLGGTTLTKQRDLLAKLKREILRPLYRLATSLRMQLFLARRGKSLHPAAAAAPGKSAEAA